MKRTLILSLVLLSITAAALADSHGAWTANLDEKHPERIYFSFSHGRNSHMGNTMSLATFPALSAAQIRSATTVPVHFELRREAGTATFDGTFRNGDGAGQYTFVSNGNYLASVRALGIDVRSDRHGRHDADEAEDELFAYALHDVSTAFIRSMIAEGYRVSLDDYLSMRIFNVTPEYIHELRALGFKDISADDVVATRIHGVTPDYIRKMRAAGWNLTLDELVASRIHGATPEFAEEMRKLGYGKLTHDDLVSFRIHGVTAAAIREYAQLGYTRLDADDLVSFRIHRVTPEFIRELAASGYKNVPAEKLIEMRIHGIDAKYIKKMGGAK
jgi:hypothetical protein